MSNNKKNALGKRKDREPESEGLVDIIHEWWNVELMQLYHKQLQGELKEAKRRVSVEADEESKKVVQRLFERCERLRLLAYQMNGDPIDASKLRIDSNGAEKPDGPRRLHFKGKMLCVKVAYGRKRKGGVRIGRRYPSNMPSLLREGDDRTGEMERKLPVTAQGMPKGIRAFCLPFLHDIDIKAAHASILLSKLKNNGVASPELDWFVSHIKECREMVMGAHNVSREIAKALFTSLLYGGSYKYRIKKWECKGVQAQPIPYVERLETELKKVREEVMHREELKQYVEPLMAYELKRKSNFTGHLKTEEEAKRSVWSQIAQMWEDEALGCIEEAVKAQGLVVHSLLFDGLMVYHDPNIDLTSAMKAAEALIKAKTGMVLMLEEKELYDADRVAAEREAERRARVEEAARVAAEREAERRARAEEAARVAAEREAERRARAEEAARVVAEREAERRARAEKAARVAAEAEAARRAAAEEEAREAEALRERAAREKAEWEAAHPVEMAARRAAQAVYDAEKHDYRLRYREEDDLPYPDFPSDDAGQARLVEWRCTFEAFLAWRLEDDAERERRRAMEAADRKRRDEENETARKAAVEAAREKRAREDRELQEWLAAHDLDAAQAMIDAALPKMRDYIEVQKHGYQLHGLDDPRARFALFETDHARYTAEKSRIHAKVAQHKRYREEAVSAVVKNARLKKDEPPTDEIYYWGRHNRHDVIYSTKDPKVPLCEGDECALCRWARNRDMMA